ncbi:unnamed protein product [Phytophthora fragariaefolia]|uniref:Unnamed protein product n=1 Tax=Phytophthora fragariaefolia TaxID=1490495 RepID=A0A9W6YNY1_9STRA|nr:unnamed protein product [Phytophthora fragariaefolia]
MAPKKKAKKSKKSNSAADAGDGGADATSQQIQKQHGPITDLKICKGHFSEANELRHDMMTLADFGIEGAPEDEPEVVRLQPIIGFLYFPSGSLSKSACYHLYWQVCLIHYDFKPEQHDNPLLLATEKN